MPQKRGKKNTKSRSIGATKRKLTLKEDMQQYALIKKNLGGRRFTAVCYDGVERIAIIRTKRLRIAEGNTVIVSLRDFGKDNISDIIHRYDDSEVRKLLKDGHIGNENLDADIQLKLDESRGGSLLPTPGEEDCAFDFDDI